MKKLFFVVPIICLILTSCSKPTYKNPNAAIEERVNDLLNRLTLEEKLNMLGGNESEMNTNGNERLGIPPLKTTDGPVGIRGEYFATAFPSAVSMASSWDTTLMNRIGIALGKETKARGHNFLLGGCVNLHRLPIGGRNFESYGEDPYLSSQLIVPYVKGIQNQNIIGCTKHFACNNQEWNRKDVNMNVDERTLREIYFPPFRAAVQEGKVLSIMSAYNSVNGVQCSENRFLLTDVLKKEWNFDGFVVSDWVSTYSTVNAANNGLDVEMPVAIYFSPDSLMLAIKQGTISEATIDEKIRRQLYALFKSGVFDSKEKPDTSIIYSSEHKQLAREIAEKGIVLLKNDKNILPLDKSDVKSIAVIGPNAAEARVGGGGSSKVLPANAVSPLEGIKNIAGEQCKVHYALGSRFRKHADALDHIVPSSMLLPPEGYKGHGLLGSYFDNVYLKGKPAAQRIDTTINFNFGDDSPVEGLPADNFSIRWTGRLVVPKTDDYKLEICSDDGMRVILDGKIILDIWGAHGPRISTNTLFLEKGKEYDIVIEYTEYMMSALAQFGWNKSANDAEEQALIDQAVEIAKNTDVAIVFAGSAWFLESEGKDRDGLELFGKQDALIKAVSAVNPNTIVVLNGGTSFFMNNWINQVPAVFQAWYFGQEGGNAIANLIFGETNPSGKLPFSFIKNYDQSPAFNGYRDTTNQVYFNEGIFMGYRYLDKNNITPRFPFGYGLSYTTFAYSGLSIEKMNEKVYQISLNVKNTGERSGAEIVQLYVSDLKSSVPRPIKELKAFSKVELQPGEEKTVHMELDDQSFAFFHPVKKEWTVEPGQFEILVGRSSRNIELRDILVVD